MSGYMSMYQDETHEPQLNKLTKRLYAEGYTRESHPDHVYWSDWQNFGYKWEYLLSLIWETPCGLLISGESEIGRSLSIGDMSFDGIWYCPENDNPDLRCPLNKPDCQYRIAGMPLIRCACHQTDKPYSYKGSVEKIEDECDKRAHEQWTEITGGQYCACVRQDSNTPENVYKVRYSIWLCIDYGCKNDFCVIRKQRRDLTPVNVFYDIRRTWITRQGFLEDKKIAVEKGVKVFKHPVARTDAEIWLKQNKDGYVRFQAKRTQEDRKMQFFTKHHRSWTDCDYFEFHYEVENIRIGGVRPSRDLLQDLADIQEGIQVTHASDTARAKAQAKKERRKKGQEDKVRRRENKNVALWKRQLEDDEFAEAYAKEHGMDVEDMRHWAKKQLTRRGVTVEKAVEQLSLF